MVLDHYLRHGDGKRMTTITTQDGKIVFRDGKVGTEQGCCCGGGGDPCPPCSDCNELTISVSYCGMQATAVAPAPGSVDPSVQVTDGDNFMIVDASVSCECGVWCVVVSLCIVCNDLFFNDSFFGCVTQTGNSCPTGNVPLECLSAELFGIPCEADVSVTLS